MSAPRAYLDHNATTPLRPQARDAMLAALETLGNPSSIHAEGRAARALIEAARCEIGAGLGTKSRNVVFTSGSTEAANLILTPFLQRDQTTAEIDLLLLGAGEHPAVLAGHRFPAERAETIGLDPEGGLSLDALADTLQRNKGKRILLALQAANNETGAIQPVAAAADLVHAAGGLLICDATQTVGRLETTFAALRVDALFFSSHKIGGPMGAGALAFAEDRLHIREALLRGGGQESGRRAGTENVAAIAGFAAAFAVAKKSMAAEAERLGALRDRLEAKVAEIWPEAMFLGAKGPRLANTSAFLTPGQKTQTLLMALDVEGVALSSGSACSSGKVKASHVLAAMGLEEKAALRASLGWSSTEEHVDLFGIAFAGVAKRIRARRTAA
ncbi:cysteine desulfurase [Methylosinus sp. R-45379]|uniref:cysteine desulfurase family protein n=1 Tax=unclassified Methylosinus TaxID=2624500 RepID=UPI000478AD7D|nr:MULTISPECIES: cysteine desulfurase family protein [unclassified Methylosinus]OAI28736.1 cysteine desulfurase [Methylosinus sp. R-45379]TDX63973.1 cysteine desulfurase [Methylosinus sp. sav-2]